jgi:hypothetical protein
MISTVTTTTAVTTTATAIAVAHAAIYGAIGVCILILLLIAKELLSAYGEEGATACRHVTKMLARDLSAAIHPLLFCFIIIVAVKVLEVL